MKPTPRVAPYFCCYAVQETQSMKYAMNQILHDDSYEILPELPDKSFDTVIIDPPYGMGIDTWDKPVDVAFFTEQIKRIGKEFYAVFGQMPYIREWDRQAEKQGLHFLEHVSWVKRIVLPNNRLSRGHEEMFIYAIGHKKRFYSLKGRYEDVKIPGIMFDTVSIESLQRVFSDMLRQLQGGEPYTMKKCENRHHAFKHFDNVDWCRVREHVNYTNVWSFLPQNRINQNKGLQFHATQKPELLVTRLVEMLTPENGSVLDCFSGSGTTAIACKRLDRQFLCIEKEQEFYDRSVDRLEGDVYQPELDFDLNEDNGHNHPLEDGRQKAAAA